MGILKITQGLGYYAKVLKQDTSNRLSGATEVDKCRHCLQIKAKDSQKPFRLHGKMQNEKYYRRSIPYKPVRIRTLKPQTYTHKTLIFKRL